MRSLIISLIEAGRTIATLVMAMAVCLIFAIIYIVRTQHEKEKFKFEKNQYQLELAYIQSIQESVWALRRWKHDYKQHLAVIRQLVQEQNYDALQNYCTKLEEIQGETGELLSTGNTAIDALMSNKLMAAKARGIQTEYEIVFTPDLLIEDVDLCILLGNVMDNAIEACAGITEEQRRYIHVVMKPKRSMYYIRIVNGSSGIYKYRNGVLASIKEEKGHGIGIGRMRQLVEENKGFCEVEAESAWFAVTVVLPRKSE